MPGLVRSGPLLTLVSATGNWLTPLGHPQGPRRLVSFGSFRCAVWQQGLREAFAFPIVNALAPPVCAHHVIKNFPLAKTRREPRWTA
jgi:hypothetical protein